MPWLYKTVKPQIAFSEWSIINFANVQSFGIKMLFSLDLTSPVSQTLDLKSCPVVQGI